MLVKHLLFIVEKQLRYNKKSNLLKLFSTGVKEKKQADEFLLF